MTTAEGLPIKLNGRSYLIDDSAAGDTSFRHVTIPRVPNQLSFTGALGERTLNPQGSWRGSQASWHLGAGQDVADAEDSSPYRYRKSEGIFPWDRGKLRLQPAVVNLHPSTSTESVFMVGNHIAVEDDVIYVTAFDETGTPTLNTVPGSPGNAHGAAWDGTKFYVAYTGGVQWTDDQGSTFTSFNTVRCAGLAFLHGRFFGWIDSRLYDFSAASDGTVYVDVQDGSTIISMTEGDGLVYIATPTSVYASVINATTGAVGVPARQATMPLGETIWEILSYLGYVLIATTRGVRLAAISGSGLTFGPSTGPEGYAATHLAVRGQYVFASTNDYTARIIRLDLAAFTDTLSPAWSADIAPPNPGTQQINRLGATEVASVDRAFFWVQGSGLYVTKLSETVTSGTLDSGEFTFGLVDTKTIHEVTLRGSTPFGGTYQLRSGRTGSLSAAGATNFVSERPEIRINLPAFSTLTSFVASATPSTDVGKFIIVPIILDPSVAWSFGAEYAVNSTTERDFIDALWKSRAVVDYTEGDYSSTVVVEDYDWRPMGVLESDDGVSHAKWVGTLVVKLKEISRA